MLEDNQTYIVVDIENNGPTPGLYSMLAIGACATNDAKEISSFYRKIAPLEGSGEHPETMKWWQSQPKAWAELSKDAEPAEKVMKDFYKWLKSLGTEPVFVAHPLAVDYTFVSWYLYKFLGHNPFEENKADIILSLDLRSFISGKFNKTLVNSSRNKLPEALKMGMPDHTHNALEDAQGYAVILRNVLDAK